MPILVHNTARLARTAKILDMPLVPTEQKADKFGNTFESIQKEYKEGTQVFEKDSFSMMTDEVTQYFESLGKDTAVLYGIEAHVCVQQTALDLAAMGVHVHLITDATSSSDTHKRNTAIQRMKQAGVHLTTFESCVFELMRT
eukprot:CAMPEP_0168321378 /NCGR_PEP_ID=MMETSP0213-20121227/2239_1 /TAXON_ID=151035 /ORGANISM="Euplotes harpa, Strain FSP1.4" /LENGTH=141 /DNA_ID=CAMNT_0008323025 /DNA_START=120 /DNA_END=545 /DNA_ORIENTATION=+